MLDQRPPEEDAVAVPESPDGPIADKDRDWHWSEQGARQVDAMPTRAAGSRSGRRTPGTTIPRATRRRRRAPTSCPTTSWSTAASTSPRRQAGRLAPPGPPLRAVRRGAAPGPV